MSLELSAKYTPSREIPTIPSDKRRISTALLRTATYLPYVATPTTERVRTTHGIDLIADMQVSYDSSLFRGYSQTAMVDFRSTDGDMRLPVETIPDIGGMWRAVEGGNLYTRQQVISHLMELAPAQFSTDRLYDTVNHTGEDLHKAFERMPRYLGGKAVYITEYQIEDLVIPAPDLPFVNTGSTLTIGTVTDYDNGQTHLGKHYAHLQAEYDLTEVGGRDNKIKYHQVATVDRAGGVDVRLHMSGSSPAVTPFAEAASNKSIVNNLMYRLEQARDEIAGDSSFIRRGIETEE